MSSEFDFISWIRAQHQPGTRVVIGPGDDLAAVRVAGGLVLVGADQVLDGVHFDARHHAPSDIGRKAMNRNLSDCAAMGANPVAAVATVALPRDFGIERARELYLGMKRAGEKFGVHTVGGDTAAWDGRLALSITILAEVAGAGPVLRSGAKPGQGIYVTGRLGGSLLGRHMTFEPRVAEGMALAQRGVGAMIDLSDGLSRDLAHLCRESGIGAVIHAVQVPVHPDAVEISRDGRTPLAHALHDGEDYELLFIAGMETNGWGHTQIGVTMNEEGLWIEHPDGRRDRLEPKAWEHRIG